MRRSANGAQSWAAAQQQLGQRSQLERLGGKGGLRPKTRAAFARRLQSNAEPSQPIYRKDETETVSHSLITKFETKKKNYKFETVARPPITK